MLGSIGLPLIRIVSAENGCIMATVYILQYANGQYYVGGTNNLADRLKEYQSAALAVFNEIDKRLLS